MRTYEQHGKIKVIATILSVVVIGGAVVTADKLKPKDTTTVTAAAPVSTPTATPSSDAASGTPTPTATAAATGTKNGNYSASVTYDVPHGEESIAVTVAISNGTVSDVSIQNSESDHDSARYQEDFTAEYKSYVVGKPINGLQLDTISGASDTTSAFNEALAKIASQSQA